jgi:hypothetical protein
MKAKKNIILAALLLLLAGTAHAQVFTMNEEENSRTAGDMDVLGRIPYHNVDYDQANAYAPLGNGILTLALLGGAYLTKKKKKDHK